MAKRTKPCLCDPTGTPVQALAGAKSVYRGTLEVPERDILRKELAGHLEQMDDADLAATLIRTRHERARDRIINMLAGPFGEIIQIMQEECGYSSERDERNFAGTARRAAEAWFDMHPPRWLLTQEMLYQLMTRFPGYRESIPGEDGIDRTYNSMVVSIDNVVWGICPHHLMPIHYIVHLAYLPNEDKQGAEVLGLSKLSRVARSIGCQPLLHEDVAELISDVLYMPEGEDAQDEDEEHSLWNKLRVRSQGSAVIVDAMHSCVCARGVTQEGARTSVMALRGTFAENDMNIRDEFLAHVERNARLRP